MFSPFRGFSQDDRAIRVGHGLYLKRFKALKHLPTNRGSLTICQEVIAPVRTTQEYPGDNLSQGGLEICSLQTISAKIALNSGLFELAMKVWLKGRDSQRPR